MPLPMTTTSYSSSVSLAETPDLVDAGSVGVAGVSRDAARHVATRTDEFSAYFWGAMPPRRAGGCRTVRAAAGLPPMDADAHRARRIVATGRESAAIAELDAITPLPMVPHPDIERSSPPETLAHVPMAQQRTRGFGRLSIDERSIPFDESHVTPITHVNEPLVLVPASLGRGAKSATASAGPTPRSRLHPSAELSAAADSWSESP